MVASEEQKPCRTAVTALDLVFSGVCSGSMRAPMRLESQAAPRLCRGVSRPRVQHLARASVVQVRMTAFDYEAEPGRPATLPAPPDPDLLAACGELSRVEPPPLPTHRSRVAQAWEQRRWLVAAVGAGLAVGVLVTFCVLLGLGLLSTPSASKPVSTGRAPEDEAPRVARAETPDDGSSGGRAFGNPVTGEVAPPTAVAALPPEEPAGSSAVVPRAYVVRPTPDRTASDARASKDRTERGPPAMEAKPASERPQAKRSTERGRAIEDRASNGTQGAGDGHERAAAAPSSDTEPDARPTGNRAAPRADRRATASSTDSSSQPLSTVRDDFAVLHGMLSDLGGKEVKPVIARNRPRMKRCYDRALRHRGRARSAELTMTLHVARSGKVADVAFTGADFGSLRRCLSDLAERLRFPASRAGAEVPVPLNFEPRGGAEP
jgi:hypothetical protein